MSVSAKSCRVDNDRQRDIRNSGSACYEYGGFRVGGIVGEQVVQVIRYRSLQAVASIQASKGDDTGMFYFQGKDDASGIYVDG